MRSPWAPGRPSTWAHPAGGRRIDPLKTYTVDQLNSMYDMLTSMKSDEIQDKLYADGAALEHNLDSSAINTYSASKIKKTVSK